MLARWHRISRDLKHRQFIDVYVISFVAFVLAGLSLVTDIVPEQVRWAALLAGMGVLVLRITIPQPPSSLDNVLQDRFAFDATPISERIRNAKELWVFAPSAVNLLSSYNCEILRKGPLSRTEGVVRVVVLDSARETAVELAKRQLDDSLDYPVQDFAASLRTTLSLLRSMAAWQISGSFGYRVLDYNPGFSLVAIDPSARNGRIIVEFHGFHNEATSSRMHIEITRNESDHWYSYWTDQFDRIWEAASLPAGKTA
jgi:hypothetical protein